MLQSLVIQASTVSYLILLKYTRCPDYLLVCAASLKSKDRQSFFCRSRLILSPQLPCFPHYWRQMKLWSWFFTLHLKFKSEDNNNKVQPSILTKKKKERKVSLLYCSTSSANKPSLGRTTEKQKDNKREQRNKTRGIIITVIDNSNSSNNNNKRASWDIKSHLFLHLPCETHCNKAAFPLSFGVPGLSAGHGQEGFISSLFAQPTSLPTYLGQQAWHFALEYKVSHKWNSDDW